VSARTVGNQSRMLAPTKNPHRTQKALSAMVSGTVELQRLGHRAREDAHAIKAFWNIN